MSIRFYIGGAHYEYFSNLLEGSFALIDKLKEKIKKANDVLDCFYSLKFMDNNNNYISTNKQKDQNNIKTNVYSESNRNLQNVNSASNIKSTRGESIVTANNTYSFADTVDNLLTSRLHTRSINWVQILFVTSLPKNNWRRSLIVLIDLSLPSLSSSSITSSLAKELK